MADTHVISALVRRYAERKGDLARSTAEARAARNDMLHLEAVLRMFRADWNAQSVRRITIRKPSRWIKRGDGLKTVLDVLREAQEPLTTHEIVRRSFERHRMPEPDAVTLRAVAGPIHKMLRDREGVVAFDGEPKRWTLAW